MLKERLKIRDTRPEAWEAFRPGSFASYWQGRANYSVTAKEWRW